jgi:hypothetical protein
VGRLRAALRLVAPFCYSLRDVRLPEIANHTVEQFREHFWSPYSILD